MPEGRYSQIVGLNKKAVWISVPVQGAQVEDNPPELVEPKGTLEAYEFKTLKTEVLGTGFFGFTVSADRKQMLLYAGSKLRVAKAGEKLDKAADKESAGRKRGWLDLQRLKVLIEPAAEWKQMLHEASRLQRDHFWRSTCRKSIGLPFLSAILPWSSASIAARSSRTWSGRCKANWAHRTPMTLAATIARSRIIL